MHIEIGMPIWYWYADWGWLVDWDWGAYWDWHADWDWNILTIDNFFSAFQQSSGLLRFAPLATCDAKEVQRKCVDTLLKKTNQFAYLPPRDNSLLIGPVGWQMVQLNIAMMSPRWSYQELTRYVHLPFTNLRQLWEEEDIWGVGSEFNL